MAYFHEQFQRGRDVFIGMVNHAKIPLEADMGDGKLGKAAVPDFSFHDPPGKGGYPQPCHDSLLDAGGVVVNAGNFGRDMVFPHDLLKEVSGAAALLAQDKRAGGEFLQSEGGLAAGSRHEYQFIFHKGDLVQMLRFDGSFHQGNVQIVLQKALLQGGSIVDARENCLLRQFVLETAKQGNEHAFAYGQGSSNAHYVKFLLTQTGGKRPVRTAMA